MFKYFYLKKSDFETIYFQNNICFKTISYKHKCVYIFFNIEKIDHITYHFIVMKKGTMVDHTFQVNQVFSSLQDSFNSGNERTFYNLIFTLFTEMFKPINLRTFENPQAIIHALEQFGNRLMLDKKDMKFVAVIYICAIELRLITSHFFRGGIFDIGHAFRLYRLFTKVDIFVKKGGVIEMHYAMQKYHTFNRHSDSFKRFLYATENECKQRKINNKNMQRVDCLKITFVEKQITGVSPIFPALPPLSPLSPLPVLSPLPKAK